MMYRTRICAGGSVSSNTPMGRLMGGYVQSETLNADLDRGLKVMAEQAEERNLPDLAEHLQE